MQTLRMMLFSRKKRKQKSDSKSEKAEHGTFTPLNPKNSPHWSLSISCGNDEGNLCHK